jgi:hypothetical protein
MKANMVDLGIIGHTSMSHNKELLSPPKTKLFFLRQDLA